MADKYLKVLQQYWGYPDFRGIQRNIIESIGEGRDTLGLMPTGGGKSITFQVPALVKEGVCIVITPLIALMKDQVVHLCERGIQADAIYSGRTRQEIVQVLENCIFGGVKILYISPERLSSELFQKKLSHMKVSFITVDEAHCISQWGYDFRPSYLSIADIRKLKPDAPILALTATATPDVVEDIQDRLGFKDKNVFKMSFYRKNLAYVVRNSSDKFQELVHILRSVPGSSIVYVRSRKRCKEISNALNDSGISATFYHAGLDSATKDERQDKWQHDEVRTMVATNAFGMGIDKPNVRVVIHIDCPDSLEAYFQEAGRAGRDGNKAYAVLLYNDGDQRKLEKRIVDSFPTKEYIADVYEHLAYFYQIGIGSGKGRTFEFNIEKFCFTYKYFPIPVDSALRILERSGYIHYESDPDDNARVMFKLTREDLYCLRTTNPDEENVITTLLRLYGGLFTDYAYIDESMIAMQTGINKQQLYLILKSLSNRKIIDFIPRKKIPYITYLQRREDGSNIFISHEVYEERKEQYIRRIRCIEAYAKNDHVCRSRQLLRYFGEENDKDCKKCDVCLSNVSENVQENRLATGRNRIIELLDHKDEVTLQDIESIDLSKDIIDNALQQLIDENIIAIKGTQVILIH
ncbi:RecQ family ATP-dependent DNA helicase [Segatella albensis]|jgi:ATP-dependent DNA helicase RecQ|uniref:RecQ family ATP-dependent DNA helicase n=1 Tax=Segatella albensis TaxID=77768 RepID=UPI000415A61D|nr:ATP-dependent DNA helicase RecQ [Segatella albensis]